MSRRGERIAARAEALAGVPFRPQGRSARTGLDCIGLAAAAAGVENVRCDYALRGGSIEELKAGLNAAGLREACEMARGDLLVLSPGPGQLHLAIFTGAGMVHADAALRRVVERPGPLPWPVIGIWRAEEEI